MGEEKAHDFGGTKAQLYTYSNGSRLWCGGLDKPKKVLSGERDWIYVNQAEELTLEDWEVCHTRTTGRGGVTQYPMTFGDCNPSSEDHWILKRDTLKVFQSKHEDNPSLFTASGVLTAQGVRTMQTLDSLTGVRKKRLRYGQWVGAEGLFFEQFDPEDGRIVIDPLEFIPEDWPIWGALDWGHVHPLAFGLFTEDNDGNVHLVFEHVQNKWLIPYHCRAIREGLRKLGIDPDRIEQIVAGHDVFQTQGGSNLEDIKTKAVQFAESKDPTTKEPNGFTLDYANVDRAQGAAELLLRMGNSDPLLGIEPTLRIWSTCKRTIATLSRMIHDPLDPEKIKKVNADPLTGEGGDDPVDMIRYGCMVRAGTTTTGAAVGGTRAGYTPV